MKIKHCLFQLFLLIKSQLYASMIFYKFFGSCAISEDNDGRQPLVGCQSVPRLRESEREMTASSRVPFSPAPLVQLQAWLSTVLVNLSGVQIDRRRSDLRTHIRHAHECISWRSTQRRSRPSASRKYLWRLIDERGCGLLIT